MIYSLLADIVLIFHFCFVLFVILGGVLLLRWRSLIWLHIPAVIWGILIEFFVWTCPLTLLENRLRILGGETGYSGGFIEHYVSLLLYFNLNYRYHLILGLGLIFINLYIYFYVFLRKRQMN